MHNLHYEIFIDAPKKKVWETMLADSTYREWTSVFNPIGSYYEGSWEEGSDIKFFGPDEEGNLSGMISRIKKSDPYNFISIEHLGMIEKGVETSLPKNENSSGLENYTFEDKDSGTELKIDLVNLPNEFKDMFDQMWPKALLKLKEIIEK